MANYKCGQHHTCTSSIVIYKLPVNNENKSFLFDFYYYGHEVTINCTYDESKIIDTAAQFDLIEREFSYPPNCHVSLWINTQYPTFEDGPTHCVYIDKDKTPSRSVKIQGKTTLNAMPNFIFVSFYIYL